jgi:RNA polymerase sigma-70 factor (ECF subfamily)
VTPREDLDREAELVRRHRRGDPEAFDEVVREHRRAVYDLARRWTGDHAAADEASQETFVRAWRSFGRFRGEATIRTWIFGIALNVLRSASRARTTERGGDASREVETRDPPAAEALIAAEAVNDVRRAVSRLPPRQREAVVLKALSEMTYEETARAMGLTVGAVKAHFHQAIRNLRRALAGGDGGTR